MKFKQILLPDNQNYFIPDDIDVVVPSVSDLPDIEPSLIHSLAYIPWSDKYLDNVPDDYRDFYKSIISKLNARTTDVHSALSVSFVDELIKLSEQATNRHILIYSRSITPRYRVGTA